jgi:hypothetical protein
MFKGRFFRSSCLVTILKILALEAVLVVLSWLLYQRSGSQRIHYSDVLLMIGVLMSFFAAFGMMSSSYGKTETPFAFRVRTSEEEQRVQMLDSLMRQKSASLYMGATGGLSILLSVFFTYVLHI